MIFQPVPSGLPHLLHEFRELLPADSSAVLDVEGPALAEGRQIAARNGVNVIAIPCDNQGTQLTKAHHTSK